MTFLSIHGIRTTTLACKPSPIEAPFPLKFVLQDEAPPHMRSMDMPSWTLIIQRRWIYRLTTLPALLACLSILPACTPHQPADEHQTFTTITQPQGLVGKFYSIDDPYNTLELTGDGKYVLTEKDHEVRGSWEVNGEKFFLISPAGKKAAGRVTGGRIVDPGGGQWVRY